LGDIASFYKGKGISKADISDNGDTPCIRYGELYTKYSVVITNIHSRTNLSPKNLFLSNANDVIIPASGETQADIATASCVTIPNVALGGDLNIIRSDQNGVYLSYYLNSQKKFEIAKLAQGNSVVHLYSSQLKTLRLNLPTFEEQEKVASFLSAIDKKISILTQKHELLIAYKKGVTQKIFSQEIRFKDDAGNPFPDWEHAPLEELLTYHQPTAFLVDSTEYSDLYKTPVLTAGKTFILGYTNETSGIFTDDLPAIIFDDFTTAFKYVDFPFKAKSSAMKILVAKDNSVNLKYVFEAMSEIRFQMGNEHKRYWISEYSKLEISKPSEVEQTKIANFLSAIDEKISNAQQQLELTKQYKQGLLQQMFV
jgi:type I restriction enzyme S subunit